MTDADAVVQQFYPGELGGLALAEIIFGDANPSGSPVFHHLSALTSEPDRRSTPPPE